MDKQLRRIVSHDVIPALVPALNSTRLDKFPGKGALPLVADSICRLMQLDEGM